MDVRAALGSVLRALRTLVVILTIIVTSAAAAGAGGETAAIVLVSGLALAALLTVVARYVSNPETPFVERVLRWWIDPNIVPTNDESRTLGRSDSSTPADASSERQSTGRPRPSAPADASVDPWETDAGDGDPDREREREPAAEGEREP